MKSKDKQQLIISLIKDDLVYNKLISGLNNMGIDALNYHLHISKTVFMLLGFGDDKKSNEAFEFYLMQLKHANYFDIKGSHEAFDTLAGDIYLKLERRKANAQ